MSSDDGFYLVKDAERAVIIRRLKRLKRRKGVPEEVDKKTDEAIEAHKRFAKLKKDLVSQTRKLKKAKMAEDVAQEASLVTKAPYDRATADLKEKQERVSSINERIQRKKKQIAEIKKRRKGISRFFKRKSEEVKNLEREIKQLQGELKEARKPLKSLRLVHKVARVRHDAKVRILNIKKAKRERLEQDLDRTRASLPGARNSADIAMIGALQQGVGFLPTAKGKDILGELQERLARNMESKGKKSELAKSKRSDEVELIAHFKEVAAEKGAGSRIKSSIRKAIEANNEVVKARRELIIKGRRLEEAKKKLAGFKEELARKASEVQRSQQEIDEKLAEKQKLEKKLKAALLSKRGKKTKEKKQAESSREHKQLKEQIKENASDIRRLRAEMEATRKEQEELTREIEAVNRVISVERDGIQKAKEKELLAERAAAVAMQKAKLQVEVYDESKKAAEKLAEGKITEENRVALADLERSLDEKRDLIDLIKDDHKGNHGVVAEMEAIKRKMGVLKRRTVSAAIKKHKQIEAARARYRAAEVNKLIAEKFTKIREEGYEKADRELDHLEVKLDKAREALEKAYEETQEKNIRAKKIAVQKAEQEFRRSQLKFKKAVKLRDAERVKLKKAQERFERERREFESIVEKAAPVITKALRVSKSRRDELVQKRAEEAKKKRAERRSSAAVSSPSAAAAAERRSASGRVDRKTPPPPPPRRRKAPPPPAPPAPSSSTPSPRTLGESQAQPDSPSPTLAGDLSAVGRESRSPSSAPSSPPAPPAPPSPPTPPPRPRVRPTVKAAETISNPSLLETGELILERPKQSMAQVVLSKLGKSPTDEQKARAKQEAEKYFKASYEQAVKNKFTEVELEKRKKKLGERDFTDAEMQKALQEINAAYEKKKKEHHPQRIFEDACFDQKFGARRHSITADEYDKALAEARSELATKAHIAAEEYVSKETSREAVEEARTRSVDKTPARMRGEKTVESREASRQAKRAELRKARAAEAPARMRGGDDKGTIGPSVSAGSVGSESLGVTDDAAARSAQAPPVAPPRTPPETDSPAVSSPTSQASVEGDRDKAATAVASLAAVEDKSSAKDGSKKVRRLQKIKKARERARKAFARSQRMMKRVRDMANRLTEKFSRSEAGTVAPSSTPRERKGKGRGRS